MTAPKEEPFLLDLANQGYDVYFSYSRGNDYSQKHSTYDVMEKEFWDFSYMDLYKDTKAQVDYIYNTTGQQVSLMSHSSGSLQFFAAMDQDYDWFSYRTKNLALISPCTVLGDAATSWMTEELFGIADHLDIFEFGGPTWYKSLPKLSALIGRRALRDFQYMGWGDTIKNVATKSLDHIAQNSREGVLQTYSETYWSPDSPEKKTRALNLSANKTIPVGMFIG